MREVDESVSNDEASIKKSPTADQAQAALDNRSHSVSLQLSERGGLKQRPAFPVKLQ